MLNSVILCLRVHDVRQPMDMRIRSGLNTHTLQQVLHIGRDLPVTKTLAVVLERSFPEVGAL